MTHYSFSEKNMLPFKVIFSLNAYIVQIKLAIDYFLNMFSVNFTKGSNNCGGCRICSLFSTGLDFISCQTAFTKHCTLHNKYYKNILSNNLEQSNNLFYNKISYYCNTVC